MAKRFSASYGGNYCAVFDGFDGNTMRTEHLVFTIVRDYERGNASYPFNFWQVRIPIFPNHYPPGELARHHGCFTGSNLDECLLQINPAAKKSRPKPIKEPTLQEAGAA